MAAFVALVGMLSVLPWSPVAPFWHSSRPDIKHVIIIVQENRSFDSYFGTYPGADGIPMKNGVPTICDPDPFTKTCIPSFHETDIESEGGPHDTPNFVADVDGGKMDGFIEQAKDDGKSSMEVMGYHNASELPVYWGYAEQYVLFDHMFAPTTSWSLGEHNYLVSNWSAICSQANVPSSCMDGFPSGVNGLGSFAWTDITWLLNAENVPWKYYVATGTSPDVINPGEDSGGRGIYIQQSPPAESIWNPLPAYTDVVVDGQLGNIVDSSVFYTDAANGTLPAVSWVVPTDSESEHPPEDITKGETYVQGLVNAVQAGPDWDTSAIFIVWDEWGGLFDHVVPPKVDWSGYGLRVPALLVSPWSKHNHVDHQELSFDAFDKLIEDLYLGSQRLDPTTDNRPDPRPDVRENYAGLGNLLNAFDFSQPPPRPFSYRPMRP
jgi:phospholipase C